MHVVKATRQFEACTRSARKAILCHLARQTGKWLHRAAEAMLQAVRSDWLMWKKKGYT